jgi:hypothetical protein
VLMHQHRRRRDRERGAARRPQKLTPEHTWYLPARRFRA